MTSKKNNKLIAIIIILLTIAGLADIKYKGKLYQILPSSIQNYINTL